AAGMALTSVRLEFRVYQAGYVGQGVQILRRRLKRFDFDAELILQESNQLQCRQRIENAAGYEQSRIRQQRGIFARQELLEDVGFYGTFRLFHRRLHLLILASTTTSDRMAQMAARRRYLVPLPLAVLLAPAA